MNNETTASMLAEAMVQIADNLPQVELASILYPNDHMRLAVVDLNAYILKFLIRANDWYTEGHWKHAWHSLTSPPELRYDDLLRLIHEKSRFIDQLSKSCQQIESRQICEKVNEMNEKVDDLKKDLEKIYTTISCEFTLYPFSFVT